MREDALGGHSADVSAQCGWLIAFVSSIIADIGEEYPNFAWWSLVYMFGCIILVFVTVATNSVQTYHVAIVGFMAAGLVFTTSSVNSLIYYSDASKEAGAAGFILLSMVSVSMRQLLRPSTIAHTPHRSYGSSTTARSHKHHTDRRSTRSHCIRIVHQVEIRGT